MTSVLRLLGSDYIPMALNSKRKTKKVLKQLNVKWQNFLPGQGEILKRYLRESAAFLSDMSSNTVVGSTDRLMPRLPLATSLYQRPLRRVVWVRCKILGLPPRKLLRFNPRYKPLPPLPLQPPPLPPLPLPNLL
jgi:hypothetical protein